MGKKSTQGHMRTCLWGWPFNYFYWCLCSCHPNKAFNWAFSSRPTPGGGEWDGSVGVYGQLEPTWPQHFFHPQLRSLISKYLCSNPILSKIFQLEKHTVSEFWDFTPHEKQLLTCSWSNSNILPHYNVPDASCPLLAAAERGNSEGYGPEPYEVALKSHLF